MKGCAMLKMIAVSMTGWALFFVQLVSPNLTPIVALVVFGAMFPPLINALMEVVEYEQKSVHKPKRR